MDFKDNKVIKIGVILNVLMESLWNSVILGFDYNEVYVVC